LIILLALILLFSAMPAHAAAGSDEVFGKLSLGFERNEGQADPKVKFLARARGYSIFLTGNETVMKFTAPKTASVRMKFLGQQRNARVEGVDALAGTTNYLLGNGASYRTNIKSYKKVRYSDIYPGIDVEYRGNGRMLEYDFVLKPGADPDKIRIAFSGVHGTSIDPSGDLILKTDADPIVQKKPHVYQEIDGQERIVEAAYLIRGRDVGFRIGGYDRTRPLVIDPELVYSTFFGGSGADAGFGIAVDPKGAVYVAGSTASPDFPIQSAAQADKKGGSSDAFIFKLDPTGSQIVYSTFIGGSGTDEAHSIAVDASGNAYITGFTQSNDFPIVNGFQTARRGLQEAYVLKLNSSGTGIVFSTFLGGSGDDRGFSIALDAANNSYVTGTTSSTNFPTANPFQRSRAGGFADGFIAKFNAVGGLVYSTYIGGIGNDNPLSIAVDANGAAYVTGWTTSINFPLANAFQTKFGGLNIPVGTDDVFVLKLNPAGNALEYSTYIGGTGSDEATRIAIDSAGSAYVTGTTTSLDFPVVKPFQSSLAQLSGSDAFVVKVAPDGKSLIYSTYFGGFQNESGTGIAVDASGAAYVAGFTNSFDLPTANQIQASIGGDRDAFVAKFAPAGNILVFSTFLGGTAADSATGITIDTAGNTYVVGFTNSGDFTTANAVQSANAGGQDVFVAKLNVQDIVSSSQFQVAPRGATSVVTKGTRTDAVFGYAVAQPAAPDTQLTGLSIISRKQSGATVSEVGIPAPPFVDTGRLFVDISATGRSVLSIANPSDQDADITFFYTDENGATTKFVTTTVKAHEHFSRFVTDDPLNIAAPGTLNFWSSIPVVATAFFTITNESNDLLLSRTPMVGEFIHNAQVGNKTMTIPEIADGGGWNSDVILVNTSENLMHGVVEFFSQGSGNQPGAPMEVPIGDVSSSVVEFEIPIRSFKKISTAGSSTISAVPFGLNRGTSFSTPGGGSAQVSGWASADSNDANVRLNGLQLLQFRQLGITQNQAGILAPALRQMGRFLAERTDKVRSFMAFANPNAVDVDLNLVLSDENGASGDVITVTVPASGQFSAFLTDQPLTIEVNTTRAVSFSASLPVFVTALRFFTNERNDSLLSQIPIADITTAVDQPVVIPQFADGGGWKTRVVLVNNTEDEVRGQIRFVGHGSPTAPPQGAVVGTDVGDNSVFEYDIQPRGFFQLQTNGLMENLSSGSVQIVPSSGFHTPASFALISDFVVDQAATAAAGDIRVNTGFETSVEGQLPATSLRFYAEAAGDFGAAQPKSTRTSIAIANPSGQPATVQLEVTSFNDVRLGLSSPITIPAGGQLAAYLFEIPGLQSLPVPFQGILRLTVQSGSGVTASSFKILFNERPDYLVTTTGPLNENAGMPGRLVFPYMTDSTGYTTQFVLINPPGVQTGSGVLNYVAADGSPLQISTLRLGSVQIIASEGSLTPFAHVILNRRDNGVLTSLFSLEAELPGTTFRTYAESVGDFDSGVAGSTRSGVTLANPSNSSATVVLEVRNLDGSLLKTSQPVQVPANGEIAVYLNQVPGLESLAAPFQGIVRVTTTSTEGVTAAGFRAINNERGNVLFTATGPLVENAGTSGQLVFPHIAEGGGFTTQFIVIGGTSGQANTGVLTFFNEEGNPLNLTLTPR
jgi:hypothetical protein